MLKTYAYDFADIIDQLRAASSAALLVGVAQRGKIPEANSFSSRIFWRGVEKNFKKAMSLCGEVGLKAAYDIGIALDRTLKTAPEMQTVAWELKSFCDVLEADLKQVYFHLVPLSKVAYFDKPYFGEKAEDRFQGAVDDMREAATCFALGRWTGVAHHCMGVVQEGMIALGADLGRPLDKYLHDWNDMITELDNAIADRRTAVLGGSKTKATGISKSNWNKQEAFYSEVMSDVRDMRRAWRNPGFHFRLDPIDENKAKKILDKTKNFMTTLTDNLPNQKKKATP